MPAFAQGKIKWGELERSTGRLSDLVTEDANSFYALRRSGMGIFSKQEVSYHKNLDLSADEKLSLRAPNGSPANFEGVTIVNDRMVVFLSDRQEGENKFFMQIGRASCRERV